GGPPAGKGTTMVMGRSGQVSAAAARGTAATSVAATPRKTRHRAIIGHPNTFRGTHAYSGYKIADAALPATSVGTKKSNGMTLFGPCRSRMPPKLDGPSGVILRTGFWPSLLTRHGAGPQTSRASRLRAAVKVRTARL